MTVQAIYRLYCDAPGCTVREVVEQITDVPDGWTRISSTDHLTGWRPGGLIPGISRRRTDKRSHSDITSGGFRLHLCPGHPGTFAEHLPSTEGTTAGRDGSRNTTIGCSCGWSTWGVRQAFVVGRRPSHAPEFAWWSHLPEELKAYATRDLTFKETA